MALSSPSWALLSAGSTGEHGAVARNRLLPRLLRFSRSRSGETGANVAFVLRQLNLRRKFLDRRVVFSTRLQITEGTTRCLKIPGVKGLKHRAHRRLDGAVAGRCCRRASLGPRAFRLRYRLVWGLRLKSRRQCRHGFGRTSFRRRGFGLEVADRLLRFLKGRGLGLGSHPGLFASVSDSAGQHPNHPGTDCEKRDKAK